MKVDLETKKRAADLVEIKGLEVAPLAKRVGVSQSTLWNFLYGKTRNFGKLPQLADEIGTTLDYLLTGKGPKTVDYDRIIPFLRYAMCHRHNKDADMEYIDTFVNEYSRRYIDAHGNIPPMNELDAAVEGSLLSKRIGGQPAMRLITSSSKDDTKE